VIVLLDQAKAVVLVVIAHVVIVLLVQVKVVVLVVNANQVVKAVVMLAVVTVHVAPTKVLGQSQPMQIRKYLESHKFSRIS
jgi:hypothetical protein